MMEIIIIVELWTKWTKTFEETIRRDRNRYVGAYLVTDDDEKLHVLGNLILRNHRRENFKYRFQLDGFLGMKLCKKYDCDSYSAFMRKILKSPFLSAIFIYV